MQEEPHLGILNREDAREVLQQHFAPQTAFLRDLANYGSNLVVRSFASSPKAMADVVLCGVLLKQIVAMVDAAEVLLAAGCGHASFLPARTAFEASLYADWILKSDSELRATRYIVGNYRDERLWAKRAIPGTLEDQAMSQITATLGFDVHANRQSLATDAVALLAEVDRVLAQPQLAPIDAEFVAARGKRKRDPEWYELDGLKSIRDMAIAVGRLPEYEFFYSRGSQISHTGSYKDHVRFVTQGQARLLPIRHLKDVNMLLNFLGSVAIRTYKRLLERYRPGELPAFTRKYQEDWRDPFLNVIQVKYDF